MIDPNKVREAARDFDGWLDCITDQDIKILREAATAWLATVEGLPEEMSYHNNWDECRRQVADMHNALLLKVRKLLGAGE